jgi:hypothetical protein
VNQRAVAAAVAEWVKGRLGHINKLKEGLRVLQVDIDDKTTQKAALVNRCNEQKTAIQYICC